MFDVSHPALDLVGMAEDLLLIRQVALLLRDDNDRGTCALTRIYWYSFLRGLVESRDELTNMRSFDPSNSGMFAG